MMRSSSTGTVRIERSAARSAAGSRSPRGHPPPWRRRTAVFPWPSRRGRCRARTGRCGGRDLRPAPAPATCTESCRPVENSERAVVGSARRGSMTATPKSSSLMRPRPRDEDVRRLHIAVDDAFGMGRVERVGNLRPEIDHASVFSGRPPIALRQDLPVEHFHRQEGTSLVLADLVDRADVGVIEAGDRARLVLETRDAAGAFGGEELDDDLAVRAPDLRRDKRPRYRLRRVFRRRGSGLRSVQSYTSPRVRCCSHYR